MKLWQRLDKTTQHVLLAEEGAVNWLRSFPPQHRQRIANFTAESLDSEVPIVMSAEGALQRFMDVFLTALTGDKALHAACLDYWADTGRPEVLYMLEGMSVSDEPHRAS